MLYNRPDEERDNEQWIASDLRHSFGNNSGSNNAPIPPLSSSSAGRGVKRSSSSSSSSTSSSASLPRGGTLIVLPTVAIRQWQMEIARFTLEGSLTVKVYHGSNREDSVADLLKDTDVILTSYKVININSIIFI
jgi:SNF2 family DNA or RNA helicase